MGFPAPILVLKDADFGILAERGRVHSNKSSLFWMVSLEVAKDIAYALTYLHTAFSRPIIHRDVDPACIVLDRDYAAKLFIYLFRFPKITHSRDSIWGI